MMTEPVIVAAKPHIVLLSPDAPGPHAPSGAGWMALRLARRLVAEGARVDLLVPREAVSDWPHTHWWDVYAQAGIALHILPWADGSDAMLGYRALEWLRHRPAPACLLALDHRGLSGSAVLARRIGLALEGLPIGLVVTGGDGWAEPAPRPVSPTRMLRRHLEREAAREADFLLFAHPALAAWHAASGLPEKPSLLLAGLGEAGWAAADDTPRLRLAGGLRDAGAARELAALLRALPVPSRLRLPPPPPNPDGPQEDPLAALVAALEGSGVTLSLDLATPDVFAPSLLAPGTILLLPDASAVTAPLALDAAALGLVPLPLDCAAVAAALAAAWVAPMAPQATPVLPFLARQSAPPPVCRALPEPPPLVSVCISHFNRPTLLAQTIDSLRAQSWPALEVVLVDDASPSAETQAWLDAQEADFAARGWQILRNETEQWQSVSRNRAARACRGAFILVMDDDNLARPHEVETMLRALLTTGADAVGALQALFEGEHDALADDRPDRVEFFPTGGPADLGVVWNVFGDVNVMFRREAFEALGGYTYERELGCEDYEIGAALARDGRRLIIIPEALYMYRFSSVNMARGMSNERLYWSHRRPLRPALEGLEPALARLVAFTHGAEHAQQQRNGWSYWAGRPLSAPLPEFGIDEGAAWGAEFRYRAALHALLAGGEGVALRWLPAMMRADPDDARLPGLLARVALRRPMEGAVRAALFAADRRDGSGLAEEVARQLLRRGNIAAARAWIAHGLPELADLLPADGTP